MGPDGGKSSQSSWGLDVSDASNDLHWGGLNDGDGLNNIFLDDLLSLTSLVVLNDMSHTGLVSHEGGKMDGLGSVVSWERSYLTSMMLCSSLGHESQTLVSGVLELSVRHIVLKDYNIIITSFQTA